MLISPPTTTTHTLTHSPTHPPVPPQELILFSRADLERSIPSMVDGLKPGQRKILFCCFKRNLVKDVKVGVGLGACYAWMGWDDELSVSSRGGWIGWPPSEPGLGVGKSCPTCPACLLMRFEAARAGW
jgi:hypothetical protein